MEAQVARSWGKFEKLPFVDRKASYDAGLGDEAPIGYNRQDEEEKFAYPRDYKLVGWPLKKEGRTRRGAKEFARAKGWGFDEVCETKTYYVFIRWVG